MNALKSNYQAVIEHIAADIKTLQQSGDTADAVSLKMLQKRHEWLVYRMRALDKCRDRAILGFRTGLEAYFSVCEKFWKEQHGRTYEKRMEQLFEVKKRLAEIYSLTGFDACYALLLTLKHLRAILPLPQYSEHAPALEALEAIKEDCQTQLGTYIKV
jgi:hypothetical protein